MPASHRVKRPRMERTGIPPIDLGHTAIATSNNVYVLLVIVLALSLAIATVYTLTRAF